MWNGDSHDNGNHARKTDDASVSKQEKNQAVRPVFELPKELETTQGTVVRIADQFAYGRESRYRWVAQAEVDAVG